MFIPSFCSAGEPREVNLVAFQKDKQQVNFESLFTGSLGSLIQGLEKDAHVILSTRTGVVKNKDIINLQTDVLRMTRDNKLANSGLNCRFIFHDESDEDSYFYSISGVCDELTSSAMGTKKRQFLVKRTMLSDPSKIFNVWIKFHVDEQTGLVFYVDID